MNTSAQYAIMCNEAAKYLGIESDLYNQEQLQQLSPISSNAELLVDIANFAMEYGGTILPSQEQESMEVLWLAYIMYHQHSKKWSGCDKKWLDIK